MKIVRITGTLEKELTEYFSFLQKVRDFSCSLPEEEKIKLDEIIEELEQEIEKMITYSKTQNTSIVALAGKLSRAPKSISEIFRTCMEDEKNNKLIKRIIGMGHESITEHDYHVFALEDVSAIIEQTLIENRLASFTIQSRREVDFTNNDFYIPTFHDKDGNVHKENSLMQEEYKRHAKRLFETYGVFVSHGAKKEEARYILPYSFFSKIVMGMNSRELKKVTVDSLLSPYSEVRELGNQFLEIMKEEIPYLEESVLKEVKKRRSKENRTSTNLLKHLDLDLSYDIFSSPFVIRMDKNTDEIILCSEIMQYYQCSYDRAKEVLKTLTEKDSSFPYALMDSIQNNARNRSLEQVNFTLQIPISLAILTHLTRHRMQNLEVPDFTPLWNMEFYHKPLYLSEEDLALYNEMYARTRRLCKSFQSRGVRDEDLIYFYQAGQMCNVVTTLNGRSLSHIASLRTCNKAQEPNRLIWNEVIRQIEEDAPIFSSLLGPNCQVLGYCPEGKESCGNMYPPRKTQEHAKQMIKKYEKID